MKLGKVRVKGNGNKTSPLSDDTLLLLLFSLAGSFQSFTYLGT